MSHEAITFDATNTWERALGYEAHAASATQDVQVEESREAVTAEAKQLVAAKLALSNWQAQELAEADALSRAEQDMTSEGDPNVNEE